MTPIEVMDTQEARLEAQLPGANAWRAGAGLIAGRMELDPQVALEGVIELEVTFARVVAGEDPRRFRIARAEERAAAAPAVLLYCGALAEEASDEDDDVLALSLRPGSRKYWRMTCGCDWLGDLRPGRDGTLRLRQEAHPFLGGLLTAAAYRRRGREEGESAIHQGLAAARKTSGLQSFVEAQALPLEDARRVAYLDGFRKALAAKAAAEERWRLAGSMPPGALVLDPLGIEWTRRGALADAEWIEIMDAPADGPLGRALRRLNPRIGAKHGVRLVGQQQPKISAEGGGVSSGPEDEGELEYYQEGGAPLGAMPASLASVIDAGEGWDALDGELCQLPENDLANAKRLERRNGGRIFWTKEWGPGVWDGSRFDFDRGDAMAGQLAQSAAEAMLNRETAAFYETQRRRGEDDKDFAKRAGRFFSFCMQAGNNGRTEAMLKQAERMLTRPLAEFDRDPDRFVVANGTIELPRDGRPPQFKPDFDPGHLITKQALATYDPGARCPQFMAFLEKVQPDPEMRAFLARLVGYCLTGHVGEQAYFVFHGKGGDGKSTLLNALQDVLGGYVANAAIDTFLKHDKKGSDHSADIARLASGVRLVKAAEPEQGAKLAESVIKTITGGEPFPARAMYREPFEFVPSWKLIISCNRKPRITGGDRGIWRRTYVVPWPISIPVEEMDRTLDAKLRREASGILNWALLGWADWLERGLAAPAGVREATEEYRMTSDPFAAWFATCCDLAEGSEERAGTLFDSYRGWMVESGFDAMKQTSFGRQLSENGLHRKRSNGIAWTGIKLNAAGHEARRSFEDSQASYGARFGGGTDEHD